jgi:hypothetical protein
MIDTPGDAEAVSGWVDTVAPSYRWGGRQGLDIVEPGVEALVLSGSYRRAAADPVARIVTEPSSGEPQAATILRPKPMESATLGVATAAASHVVSPVGTADRFGVVRRLLRAARHVAAEDGVELLILRVDSDDVDTLAAAQCEGFAVHEATTTWLADSGTDAAQAPLPPGLRVEIHEGDVTAALSPEEIEQLAEATARWDLNHFHADPLIPRAAVDRFYRQWVHNIASGEWSDCLFVARLDGRVVGVESEVSDGELRDLTGVDVRAGEWIVVLERGVGAGAALMSAAGHHRFPSGRYHSWETQIRNAPTIRCIEQTGVARPIRSAYTLHAWPRA